MKHIKNRTDFPYWVPFLMNSFPWCSFIRFSDMDKQFSCHTTWLKGHVIVMQKDHYLKIKANTTYMLMSKEFLTNFE